LMLMDAGGEMISVFLRVTEDLASYEVDLKGLNPNFDTSRIRSMEFKVDQETEPTNKHARFNLWLKELAEKLDVRL